MVCLYQNCVDWIIIIVLHTTWCYSILFPVLFVSNFIELYNTCWTFVIVMKRKARWKLEKLARKRRRTEKSGVLHVIVVVKELLSHSSMTRCFEMCSHRLSQNLQQEISVPLQGIFISDVTIILMTPYPCMCTLLWKCVMVTQLFSLCTGVITSA
jgi:hypothetical protein